MPIEFSGGKRFSSLSEMVQRDLHERLEQKRNDIRRAIEKTRCPVHGTRPAMTQKQSGDTTTFEVVDPCCEQLRQAADQAATSAARA